MYVYVCAYVCSVASDSLQLHGQTVVSLAPSYGKSYGISQARILEWVAISFSRGSSQPRDHTPVSWVSCTGRWVLSQ